MAKLLTFIFVAKLLTGVLFSTAINVVVIAKPLILAILFSISVILPI